jgi:type IV secretory pathway VirB2 component (pilin)
MKHIAGKVLGMAGCLGVIVACAALIAGKNDIRRFRRMRSM